MNEWIFIHNWECYIQIFHVSLIIFGHCFTLSLSLFIFSFNHFFFVLFCLPAPECHSGVATLSITDSSATSSEDASNPDSPDNNAAVNNDLLHHLNGSKCSKQNQQVPNNNNNSNHNKNKQVRIYSHQILFACIIRSVCVFFFSFFVCFFLYSFSFQFCRLSVVYACVCFFCVCVFNVYKYVCDILIEWIVFFFLLFFFLSLFFFFAGNGMQCTTISMAMECQYEVNSTATNGFRFKKCTITTATTRTVKVINFKRKENDRQ